MTMGETFLTHAFNFCSSNFDSAIKRSRAVPTLTSIFYLSSLDFMWNEGGSDERYRAKSDVVCIQSSQMTD